MTDEGKRSRFRRHELGLLLVWLGLLSFLAYVIWQWIRIPLLPDWLKAALLAVSIGMSILAVVAGSDRRAERFFIPLMHWFFRFLILLSVVAVLAVFSYCVHLEVYSASPREETRKEEDQRFFVSRGYEAVFSRDISGYTLVFHRRTSEPFREVGLQMQE